MVRRELFAVISQKSISWQSAKMAAAIRFELLTVDRSLFALLLIRRGFYDQDGTSRMAHNGLSS